MLIRRGYVEFLLGTLDEGVLEAMWGLGFRAAVLRPGLRARGWASVHMPVFTMAPPDVPADVVGVSVSDRHRLNLYISDRRVQAIAVDPLRLRPTRRQVRIAGGNGKVFLVPVMPLVREHRLAELRSLLDLLDPEFAVPTLGVSGMGDVRGPIDFKSFLTVMGGEEWGRALDRGLRVLVDMLFGHGVC